MHNPRSGTLLPRLLAIIVIAAFTGCAYYNTFYLAKRYYREGQKAQEKSLSESTAPEAVAKYDAVVRQCTKVITEYPKSKYVDDATYLMGAALYGKGDYSGAIKRLEELQAKFPKSPYIPEARLVQGLSYFKRKEYDVADSIFHAIDAAYPKFPRKWELYFHEGESKASQKDVPAALWWYGRALDASSERRNRSDALRRAGDALVSADRMDSAQVVYEQTLKVEERPKQKLDVAFKRADALRELKRYAEALAFLNEWKSTAVAEDRLGELELRIYENQALMGKTQEAIKGYQQLIERFPTTIVAYQAQFQIGYLYESALGDLDQAAREYDKLRAVGTGNQFGAQAMRRSQSLATLKQYRQAMASDTTGARARNAFRLAEVYYFELGKTDSALAQYQSVEALFPSSSFAPKSAYARLWITAYDRKDTLGTMLLTDMMVSRYRGTRYAESALYLWKRWSGKQDQRTALFDSLLAHPDTSAAWRFAEEPAHAVADTLAAPAHPDSGYTIPGDQLKQLEEASRRAREATKARRAGALPDSAAVHPDSTGAAPAPSGPAGPAGPAGPPGPAGSAPSDTSSAPADTTRVRAPADTTKTGTTQPRQ